MTFSPTADGLAVATIRTLSADMVSAANSGHPGAPMGCAPMAHVLFARCIKASPAEPKWFNRDRFVLSNGHACALQYAMLHLLGYDLSVEDLKQFRQLDSKTPGHPEVFMTPGVEVCTGPLGQGISNAVGMAIAQAHLAATFNRPPAFPSVIDNYTFCISGDGCLQEGVASEAASIAGHLGLGRLIVLWDDNRIQIDGGTDLAFSEDVLKRFEAYGWHTSSVENGDSDMNAILAAVNAAKAVADKPSIIKVRTTIGFGAKLQGTEKVHGAPLPADDLAAVKVSNGFDPTKHFHVPDDVRALYAEVKARGARAAAEWHAMMVEYARAHPQLHAELARRIDGKLPVDWRTKLPQYKPSDPAVATRKLSENVLNAIADGLPELVGGSADLTHSNLTRWKSAIDFQCQGSSLGSPAGRYLRFGVREHAMAAICNGLAAYGAIVPFGATFLNFIGYAQGAVRLSALSHFRVLYIMTHDSIGLGEDGPTHQPIEILALLRATPNVLVLRPADGNEVSGAYIAAMENEHRPSVLCLTRQNLPHLEGSSIEASLKGAYVLQEVGGAPAQVVLVGTGSEVSLCVDGAKQLAAEGVKSRVVSMPSWELFEEQSPAYKQSVFPAGIPVLSVEVMSTMGWERYAHGSLGMKTFGASAPAKDLFKKFGFTTGNVVDKAKALIKFYAGKPVPHLVVKPF